MYWLLLKLLPFDDLLTVGLLVAIAVGLQMAGVDLLGMASDFLGDLLLDDLTFW